MRQLKVRLPHVRTPYSNGPSKGTGLICRMPDGDKKNLELLRLLNGWLKKSKITKWLSDGWLVANAPLRGSFITWSWSVSVRNFKVEDKSIDQLAPRLPRAYLVIDHLLQ